MSTKFDEAGGVAAELEEGAGWELAASVAAGGGMEAVNVLETVARGSVFGAAVGRGVGFVVGWAAADWEELGLGASQGRRCMFQAATMTAKSETTARSARRSMPLWSEGGTTGAWATEVGGGTLAFLKSSAGLGRRASSSSGS